MPNPPLLTFEELIFILRHLSDEGAIERTANTAELFDRLRENQQIEPIIAWEGDPALCPEWMLSRDGLQDAVQVLLEHILDMDKFNTDQISHLHDRIAKLEKPL